MRSASMFQVPKQRTDIVIYGNLLINTPLKLEMLRFTFPLWHHYWKCKSYIRVRGDFAGEAADFLGHFVDAQVAIGSNFHQWRRQAAYDVARFDCVFIFQLFEDHMPSPEIMGPEKIVSDLHAANVDILQYSWFRSYEPFAQLLMEQGADKRDALICLNIDKRASREFSKTNTLYYVSLTSVFRRAVYIDILRSHKPIIRRYDPHAPFDVEQAPSSKWYLPIRFSLPKSELGICLDDDHLVAGSSATSRGLFLGPSARTTTAHQGRISLRNSIYKTASKLSDKYLPREIATRLNRLMSRVTSFLDMVFFSISGSILNVWDSHIEESIQKD